jgi:hypothetical protein
MLKKTLGSKKAEVVEEWRRLHNEELHNLQISPNISRVINSRRMRLAGHVVRTGEMRNTYKISVGKPAREE